MHRLYCTPGEHQFPWAREVSLDVLVEANSIYGYSKVMSKANTYSFVFRCLAITMS